MGLVTKMFVARADSIVADAEVLRRFLVRQDGVCKGRWTVLGQSFGGFCALTYLSFAPNGVLVLMMMATTHLVIRQGCTRSC